MVQQSHPTLIEYPETDGQPMTESDATRNYMVYCIAALRLFFQSRSQVYVSGNLLELEQSRVQAEQRVGEAQHRVKQAEQAAQEERLRAEQAEQTLQEERLRAMQAEQTAQEEHLRDERLAEQLRSLGIDPNSLPE